MFLAGMYINIRSDVILTRLKGQSEGTYKIPKGGFPERLLEMKFVKQRNKIGSIRSRLDIAICGIVRCYIN